MLTVLRRGFLILLALLPLFAAASTTPHQVVQQTTETLLDDLKKNKAFYKSNPQAFYDALNRILGPVVDADGISRSIMTVKYSRQASPEQMTRFQENFKRSLMQFYGNALLEYTNQDIRVLPSSAPAAGDRASVGMEVRDTQGTVYPVSYTMVKKQDQWLLRNVVINGINIGKLFRDQFADSMQRNGQNLDKTIDGWADVVAKAKDSEEGRKAQGQ
ncbi:organic solvent tolerance ABC efflux transporter, auxiliary component [Azotobacter vinelandii CA]|uniref:Organic solvent tolerance ABC efflux transporter, auxiliary component n=2 Tax=Azotobacter vinelandii TaxID=354 RepID=C1DQ62_AZOVD|nr:ABC transporter substrate-binding protein [Azotobacter vinelandii]ACO77514.1 organic solvent tolerance ABC efflux transporter, auxiliary component [Azotobacter vinelandii DJ]AGK15352.1 organic solvent tolerance ABC efflux transporter, auxiliary component [Azotobacter vinelandii CA]AGK19845.1 organic solvent tolerance ABC efflux transporter, auxiliary component [Azotobacter vinelandii CA6]WKN23298.1 ABC transporter substrate-binding protein [Azotobacter vinelandii]SFX48447.1 phospholipid tra